MSSSVENSFIRLYESEVKAAYQREGSFLRNTVRTREKVEAERIYFPKLGKGEATSKARHANVVPMELEHSKVYADMEDFYAPEYIDDLDAAKTNISLRQDYARASAWALGRATDSLIINALDTTNNSNALSTYNNATELNFDVITGVSKQLNQRDVPQDMMRYAVISPAALQDLLHLAQATSADYAVQKILTTGREPAFWMGFNWIVHTGLPSNVVGYFFHQPSVGLGVCQPITTQVDWIAQKVAWLVNSWMSMGATIIDNDGVIEVTN